MVIKCKNRRKKIEYQSAAWIFAHLPENEINQLMAFCCQPIFAGRLGRTWQDSRSFGRHDNGNGRTNWPKPISKLAQTAGRVAGVDSAVMGCRRANNSDLIYARKIALNQHLIYAFHAPTIFLLKSAMWLKKKGHKKYIRGIIGMFFSRGIIGMSKLTSYLWGFGL